MALLNSSRKLLQMLSLLTSPAAPLQTLPDGRKVSGYFASTFTWQEITQMRAAQPLTFRDQSYNGKYQCALADKQPRLRHRQSSSSAWLLAIIPVHHLQTALNNIEPLQTSSQSHRSTISARCFSAHSRRDVGLRGAAV